jgi:hypothetical protein
MKKNCARKSPRGGRALLSGLMRCGRCGRMMRVFYGMGKGNAHRDHCRGGDALVGVGLCIGIGGMRVDRAVALHCWRQSPIALLKPQSLPRTRSSRSQKGITAAVEREPALKHRWQVVDTNWWTLRSAMSLKSWRHAGITR